MEYSIWDMTQKMQEAKLFDYFNLLAEVHNEVFDWLKWCTVYIKSFLEVAFSKHATFVLLNEGLPKICANS